MCSGPPDSHYPSLPLAHVPAYLVLVELAHQWAGKEVAVVHSQSKGATMWGAQQGGHGLQKADCDAWHLGVPLADPCQLLAQGLLQCQGKGAWAGALPPWIWAQRKDLESRYKNAEARHSCGSHVDPASGPSDLVPSALTKGPGIFAGRVAGESNIPRAACEGQRYLAS